MGLCGHFRCGCSITTDGSIDISGSGEPSDPFVLAAVSNFALTQFSRFADVTISSGAEYYVVWDTESADQAGWGTTGSSTLVCPTSGLYAVSLSVLRGAGAGGLSAAVYLNGATTAITLTTIEASEAMLLDLTAGDQVRARVWESNLSGSKVLDSATIRIIRLS